MRRWMGWLCCLALALPALRGEARDFEFTYAVSAAELPVQQAVDMYIPLPVESADQQVLSESLRSSHPGEVGTEPKYGNRYYHIHREAGDARPIEVQFTFQVRREVATARPGAIDARARELYLAPNRLVPVGADFLQPILAEIRRQRTDDSPAATARAIYDWVVANVEYKKVGTGWGNGDTFWACSERYGNCTDFHALFISLARSEGIPARFEIGFPVPQDKPAGDIGGYHCWVRVYLPRQGWVPIDASEAAKHPELKELLYGTQPEDRIEFSIGRDLVLSPGSAGQPLNYFVYPYVEVGGVPDGDKLQTRFSYRDLTAG